MPPSRLMFCTDSPDSGGVRVETLPPVRWMLDIVRDEAQKHQGVAIQAYRRVRVGGIPISSEAHALLCVLHGEIGRADDSMICTTVRFTGVAAPPADSSAWSSQRDATPQSRSESEGNAGSDGAGDRPPSEASTSDSRAPDSTAGPPSASSNVGADDSAGDAASVGGSTAPAGVEAGKTAATVTGGASGGAARGVEKGLIPSVESELAGKTGQLDGAVAAKSQLLSEADELARKADELAKVAKEAQAELTNGVTRVDDMADAVRAGQQLSNAQTGIRTVGDQADVVAKQIANASADIGSLAQEVAGLGKKLDVLKQVVKVAGKGVPAVASVVEVGLAAPEIYDAFADDCDHKAAVLSGTAAGSLAGGMAGGWLGVGACVLIGVPTGGLGGIACAVVLGGGGAYLGSEAGGAAAASGVDAGLRSLGSTPSGSPHCGP